MLRWNYHIGVHSYTFILNLMFQVERDSKGFRFENFPLGCTWLWRFTIIYMQGNNASYKKIVLYLWWICEIGDEFQLSICFNFHLIFYCLLHVGGRCQWCIEWISMLLTHPITLSTLPNYKKSSRWLKALEVFVTRLYQKNYN